jgi:hypothetical protein
MRVVEVDCHLRLEPARYHASHYFCYTNLSFMVFLLANWISPIHFRQMQWQIVRFLLGRWKELELLCDFLQSI